MLNMGRGPSGVPPAVRRHQGAWSRSTTAVDLTSSRRRQHLGLPDCTRPSTTAWLRRDGALRDKHICSSQGTNPRIQRFLCACEYSFKLTDQRHSRGRNMARGVPGDGGTRKCPVSVGREEHPSTVQRNSYELARDLRQLKSANFGMPS